MCPCKNEMRDLEYSQEYCWKDKVWYPCRHLLVSWKYHNRTCIEIFHIGWSSGAAGCVSACSYILTHSGMNPQRSKLMWPSGLLSFDQWLQKNKTSILDINPECINNETTLVKFSYHICTYFAIFSRNQLLFFFQRWEFGARFRPCHALLAPPFITSLVVLLFPDPLVMSHLYDVYSMKNKLIFSLFFIF